MALHLAGIAGTQAGKRFDLATELTIGREGGNTIHLPNDSGVSRRHARIFWLQGLPTIEDLGSRNGTFLNGARITQARPVSSGDEVRIGGEVFRVEAAIDQPPPGTAQPPPAPGQERPRGEGRGRRNRKYESSGAEGSLYKQPTGHDPGGCALPDFDLSGCMRYLWILLVILLIAAVLALIVFGVGLLTSAASGVGAAGGSTPAPSQPAPQNPPPSGSGGGGQPPPPQQQQQQGEGVVIVDVKVDFGKRGGPQAVPIVLVKWVNGTKSNVNRLFGTVLLFSRDGKLLAEVPREPIYEGPPVAPGETHEDTLDQGGIAIRRKLADTPVTAQVKIERVE